MQAMAPGNSVDLQAGHSVGVVAADGAGGMDTDGDDGAVGPGRGAVMPGLLPPATPAPTGWGAGAPTMNTCLQDGQRTCLPAALSGTCIVLLQCGQRMT